MGIEPTHQLVTGALVLKTRRPTRRLGTSEDDLFSHTRGASCKATPRLEKADPIGRVRGKEL